MVSFIACKQTPKTTETTTEALFKDVELAEFLKLKKQADAQLVDVRTPEEYNEGYIAGAQNIDFRNDNFNENISGLNKEKPVILYCRSGGRSSSAMNNLQELGFKEVYNLLDGYLGYVDAMEKKE
jgi:rhodanese-related sulfurtransferase